MDDKDLYSGLIRLHVLSHACREPVFGLRAGVGKVKEPAAQVLLKTSAAVIDGLIKAFDDYEKRREIEP
jgi:hypothetical protein